MFVSSRSRELFRSVSATSFVDLPKPLPEASPALFVSTLGGTLGVAISNTLLFDPRPFCPLEMRHILLVQDAVFAWAVRRLARVRCEGGWRSSGRHADVVGAAEHWGNLGVCGSREGFERGGHG